MDTFAQRLAKRELLKEVTLATGLQIRVRNLTSLDLAGAGVPVLLASIVEPSRKARRARPGASSDPAAAASVVASDSSLLQRAMELHVALLRAGVAGARNPDSGEWEDLYVVATEAEVDLGANRVHLSLFSSEEQLALVNEILALSGARGAIAEAVARFHRQGA